MTGGGPEHGEVSWLRQGEGERLVAVIVSKPRGMRLDKSDDTVVCGFQIVSTPKAVVEVRSQGPKRDAWLHAEMEQHP